MPETKGPNWRIARPAAFRRRLLIAGATAMMLFGVVFALAALNDQSKARFIFDLILSLCFLVSGGIQAASVRADRVEWDKDGIRIRQNLIDRGFWAWQNLDDVNARRFLTGTVLNFGGHGSCIISANTGQMTRANF